MQPEYTDTSSHLRNVLDTKKRREMARRAASTLLSSSGVPPIEAIACQGMSGTLFATALAHEMDLPMCIARKNENPNPHSSQPMEGPDDPDQAFHYLFVDDLISTGETMRRVVNAMTGRYGNKARMSAICLYEEVSVCTLSYARVTVPVFSVGRRLTEFDDHMKRQSIRELCKHIEQPAKGTYGDIGMGFRL